jgi:endonuclease G, mitochondrial
MPDNINERLRKLLAEIQKNDPSLGKELESKRAEPETEAKALSIGPMSAATESLEESFTIGEPEILTEAVILRTGRPVLTIFNNDVKLEFRDAESEVWRQRLTDAKNIVAGVIPSVGRIEVQNHPQLDWAGTGWFIEKNIIVTNRHVAELFARNTSKGFIFRQSVTGNSMGSAIDLLQEADNPEKWIYRVTEILHIEPEPGPDIAFMRVDLSQGTPPPPLPLSNNSISLQSNVAVIGYPAKDSRMPEVDLMERIFGSVYNKKRLAPGQITNIKPTQLFHDCSTLGGCSGSAVVDLATGRVAGLHFAGRFLEANFAVPASVISQSLSKIKGRTAGSGRTPVRTTPEISTPSPDTSASQTVIQPTTMQGNQISFTIPVNVTVSLGQPSFGGQPQPQQATGAAIQPQRSQDDIDNDELITEARVEDFADREGYDEAFLGEGFEVPLPEPVSERRKNDLLKYDNNGQQDHVLRYEHFSVAMSKARRMCIYSAVNIDGSFAKTKIARTPWRLDPRIPKEAQIIKECYGSPPKFSRGHMSRREDPIWGTEAQRARGNSDSMTVTNATPQMQSFNAPVWLALEDYALGNAREDKMRISVITGPILRSNDPVRFGVKVPVQFWKVIAFIHDETGELSATGYRMSQIDHLPEEEFVFGEFDTAQLPIKKIENLTGLSFGNLSQHDPMNGDTESIEGPDMGDRPLASLKEIKFR